MSSITLAHLVREYLDRVVNRHELAAVDELVSGDYRGTGPGWPPDLANLRQFYEFQAQFRPDWRIDVQETVAVGDHVAVRAYAGGTIAHDEAGTPLEAAFRKDIEWLAVYRFAGGRVAEVNFLTAVDRPSEV